MFISGKKEYPFKPVMTSYERKKLIKISTVFEKRAKRKGKLWLTFDR